MASTNYTNTDLQQDQADKNYQDITDPNDGKRTRGEVVNSEENNVVNSEDQEEVVNEEDAAVAGAGDADGKEKGYEEGLRDDSLTEPELKDSDDQLEFPGEEGE